jgi:hypothetical protein
MDLDKSINFPNKKFKGDKMGKIGEVQISKDVIIKIYEDVNNGVKIKDIVEKYNISQATAYRIKKLSYKYYREVIEDHYRKTEETEKVTDNVAIKEEIPFNNFNFLNIEKYLNKSFNDLSESDKKEFFKYLLLILIAFKNERG